MKINLNSDEDNFTFNVDDFVLSLSEKALKRLIELIAWDKLLPQIEKHITGESEFWSTCTDGTRKGRKIREAILNFQNIEPEYKKDLQHEVNTYRSKAKYYKKFYDWYFKLYHYEDRELYKSIKKAIGIPD